MTLPRTKTSGWSRAFSSGSGPPGRPHPVVVDGRGRAGSGSMAPGRSRASHWRPGRRAGPDAFDGTEQVFAGCGFTEVVRPTEDRVVMRRDLRP